MKLYSPKEFSAILDILKEGSVVAIPTDTVYGLAVVSSLPGCLEKLYLLKNRPREVSIALLVADSSQVNEIADLNDPRLNRIMEQLWPGPLTLVLDKLPETKLADFYGDDGSIGIRCPDNDFVRSLASELGPLFTTSANRHGLPPATSAKEVLDQFESEKSGELLGAVVDGGICNNTPSTVIDLRKGDLKLLREGPVSIDLVTQCLK